MGILVLISVLWYFVKQRPPDGWLVGKGVNMQRATLISAFVLFGLLALAGGRAALDVRDKAIRNAWAEQDRPRQEEQIAKKRAWESHQREVVAYLNAATGQA